jgi:hypothetical protein
VGAIECLAALDARVCPKSSRRIIARDRDAAPALASRASAFLPAPTIAVWALAFPNAKPTWRKDDDAAEAGMENEMNAMT